MSADISHYALYESMTAPAGFIFKGEVIKNGPAVAEETKGSSVRRTPETVVSRHSEGLPNKVKGEPGMTRHSRDVWRALARLYEPSQLSPQCKAMRFIGCIEKLIGLNWVYLPARPFQ